MPTSLERTIRDTLGKIELDETTRFESESKKRYLQKILVEEEQNNKLNEPKVFVSFTGATGRDLLEEVIKKINHTKTTDTKVNFRARNGMRADQAGKSDVMDHVIEQIKPCCIFVGILTKEYELTDINPKGGNFAPGGWALLEAGMALSLGLPVIFFFQDGIHEEFWKKYLGHKKHVKFELKTYKRELGLLMKRVEEAYKELRKARVSE